MLQVRSSNLGIGHFHYLGCLPLLPTNVDQNPSILQWLGSAEDPQTLSSDTSATAGRRNTSHSTGVRRKNSAAIKLVAEATVEGSDKLVASLKEINETSEDMRKEEMVMELRIHEENLRYKQEKDKVLLENSKLALLNQTAVIAAMASMAEAIRGIRAPRDCGTGSIDDQPNPVSTDGCGPKDSGVDGGRSPA
jgi:hypothetical protein